VVGRITGSTGTHVLLSAFFWFLVLLVSSLVVVQFQSSEMTLLATRDS
jgi:hypothetical protein